MKLTQPTMQFRWLHKNTPGGRNITVGNYHSVYMRLQQLWIDNEGSEEWKDIPIVKNTIAETDNETNTS